MFYRGRIGLRTGTAPINPRIPAGECGQSTSPQSVRTTGFVLPTIGLRSNKTVTWHPIPSAMPMMRPAINAIVEIMAWSLQEF